VTASSGQGNDYTRDRGKKGSERLTLGGLAKLWPTTRAGDGVSGLQVKDGKRGLSLITATKLWPAVQTDSFRSRGGDRKDEMGLGKLAKLWPAVAARDFRTPNTADSQARRNDGSSRGQQLPNFAAHEWPAEDCLSSLHDLLTTLPGWACSAKDRRLSPLFAEMLMGWPAGWTDCAQPVTGWSHWLRLSRSSLSHLVSASTLATAA
jgi:hypothetical protein